MHLQDHIELFRKRSPIRPIHVRGLADEGFGGFHEGFAQRGVRVDAVGEVAGDGGGFDGEDTFGNQLARAGSDDADAEDSLGLRVDDQFRKALRAASVWARPEAAHGKRMTFTSRS